MVRAGLSRFFGILFSLRSYLLICFPLLNGAVTWRDADGILMGLDYVFSLAGPFFLLICDETVSVGGLAGCYEGSWLLDLLQLNLLLDLVKGIAGDVIFWPCSFLVSPEIPAGWMRADLW
ncbi:hypothetical protein Nepgr_022870 [Nepenthes gracilis]|uniref:Uncharacterized protein n=1 Tax=Nepenthes gracilis TaxID=150966 RepID=A0AAD3XXE2_NEPGR|nr:hypothetical protein Nepgr_022870 [Nepenthes gracilis]